MAVGTLLLLISHSTETKGYNCNHRRAKKVLTVRQDKRKQWSQPCLKKVRSGTLPTTEVAWGKPQPEGAAKGDRPQFKADYIYWSISTRAQAQPRFSTNLAIKKYRANHVTEGAEETRGQCLLVSSTSSQATWRKRSFKELSPDLAEVKRRVTRKKQKPLKVAQWMVLTAKRSRILMHHSKLSGSGHQRNLPQEIWSAQRAQLDFSEEGKKKKSTPRCLYDIGTMPVQRAENLRL